MEELNKNQLVLLNILVSFVVSIATGIMTVSLMQDSPVPITQTINRVVERTIEQVVPVEQKPIIREVPVIVTEEDLIAKVINSASASVVSVLQVADGKAQVISTGFYVQSSLVATFLPDIDKQKKYQLSSGRKTFEAEIVSVHTDGVVIFKLGKPLSETPEKEKTSLFGLIKEDKQQTTSTASSTQSVGLKLSGTPATIGQTVIGMGAVEDNNVVSVGIISRFGQTASTSLAILRTNAATSDTVGGPLLNIKGEVVGINRASGEALSATAITQAVDSIKK